MKKLFLMLALLLCFSMFMSAESVHILHTHANAEIPENTENASLGEDLDGTENDGASNDDGETPVTDTDGSENLIDTEENHQHDDENTANHELSESEKCLCGRPYHLDDGDGYFKYDCIKCKKNYYLCTCDCFCGAPSYPAPSTVAGGIQPRYCSRCELPCPECICADSTVAIRNEQDIRSGKISNMGIQKPPSVIALLFVAAFVSAPVAFSSYSYKKIGDKNFLKKLTSVNNFEDKDKNNGDTEINEVTTAEEVNPSQSTLNFEENPISGRLPAINAFKIAFSSLRKKTVYEKVAFKNLPFTNFASEHLAVLYKLSGINATIELPFKTNKGESFVKSEKFLENAKLLNENKTEDKVLSDDGILLSETIFAPETLFEISNKRVGLYKIYQKNDLYTILHKNLDGSFDIAQKVERQILISFIKNEICFSQKGNGGNTGLDISLSYDEWYVLLCALMINKSSFSDTELKNRVNRNFLEKGLEDAECFETADSINELFKNKQLLADTIASVIKKKLLVFDGTGFMLPSHIYEWISLKNIVDILYFENKKQDSGYSMLFALSDCGAVGIYDSGNGVRIVSSANIPWAFYLK